MGDIHDDLREVVKLCTQDAPRGLSIQNRYQWDDARAYEALRFIQKHGPALLARQEGEDAALWRGLISSARIRVLGSAGLHTETDPYGRPWDGYAHIGLELWTKHDTPHPPENVELLTKYARIAARSGGGG